MRIFLQWHSKIAGHLIFTTTTTTTTTKSGRMMLAKIFPTNLKYLVRSGVSWVQNCLKFHIKRSYNTLKELSLTINIFKKIHYIIKCESFSKDSPTSDNIVSGPHECLKGQCQGMGDWARVRANLDFCPPCHEIKIYQKYCISSSITAIRPWDINFTAWEPRRAIFILIVVVVFTKNTHSVHNFIHVPCLDTAVRKS